MEEIKYMLVIKRMNNDYRPIPWISLPSYNNENLNTLEGIDEFTKKTSEVTLITELLDEAIVDEEELFDSFTIIYKENGKTREIKEGIIYSNKKDKVTDNNILNLLKDNYNNTNLYNHILNKIKKYKDIKEVCEFMFILKNINLFEAKGEKAIKVALSKYKELPYKIKRKVSLELIDKLPNE